MHFSRGPSRARWGNWIPWNYRQLWATLTWWEPNLGLLQELYVLLTAESSLQTWPWDSCWGYGSLNTFLKCFCTYFFTCGAWWAGINKVENNSGVNSMGWWFVSSITDIVCDYYSQCWVFNTFCEALFSILQYGASKCTCLYCVALSNIYTAGQRGCWGRIELEDLVLVFWRGQGHDLTLLLSSLTCTQW